MFARKCKNLLDPRGGCAYFHSPLESSGLFGMIQRHSRSVSRLAGLSGFVLWLEGLA